MDWHVTRDAVVEYTCHKGEGGVEHLTRALHARRFADREAAWLFMAALLRLDGVVEDLPVLVVTDALPKNTQGEYMFKGRILRIHSHLRVGTLVHEAAHHVQRTMEWVEQGGPEGKLAGRGRWWEPSHGRLFKRHLRRLAKQARRMLGLPADAKVYRYRVGMDVRILDMDHRRATLVHNYGKGSWSAEDEHGGRYRVHVGHMRPVEE